MASSILRAWSYSAAMRRVNWKWSREPQQLGAGGRLEPEALGERVLQMLLLLGAELAVGVRQLQQ